jgi:hypothetical protein
MIGLALPAARMRPILLKGPFSFQKIFEDEEFIASGILTLPLDGHKPVRETKDNTYVGVNSLLAVVTLMLFF